MSAFLNRPSFDLVVDLINVANTLALNDAKVTFGVPSALVDDDSDLNTALNVKAISGAGYRGAVDVKYNRLDLALLFKNIAVNLNVDLSVITGPTTKDLLATLNTKYGLDIDVTEIDDQPINVTVDGPSTHTITAKDSLAYIGSLTVSIGPDPDVGERLDTVVLVSNLNGLLYPNSDTTKAQAREYSWGVDASPISAYLQVRVVDEVISDNSLAVELNKIVSDTWVYDAAAADYNTAGAKVIYAGPNDVSMDVNQKWARVVQFQLDDALCANVGGVITLGYN